VEEFMDETFVVASGDVLADVDIKTLYDYHKDKNSIATMALTEVEEPTEFGIVGFDEENRIVRFKEKPKTEEVFSNLINAGIYVLEPKVLDFIPENEMYDFSADVFPSLLDKKLPIYGRKIEGIWMDIGRPKDLLKASIEIVRREGKQIRLEGIQSKGPLILGKNVVIESGVRIHGPCYIGDNTHLSRGTLVEKSCIYDGVFVDRGAVVQNSIILDKSRIGWQSEIRDSVISKNCNIEEDVRIVSSIVGDDMTIKIHSRLIDANVSPPSEVAT